MNRRKFLSAIPFLAAFPFLGKAKTPKNKFVEDPHVCIHGQFVVRGADLVLVRTKISKID